uniref:Uncharacterized protein n=1 Tax=Plectus sambesii TaxID=2011161 RepID=A0A914XGG1_9BILA
MSEHRRVHPAAIQNGKSRCVSFDVHAADHPTTTANGEDQKKRASVSSLSTTRQLAFTNTGDLTFRHHQLDMFYNEQGMNLIATIGTWLIFGVTALLLVVFWAKNKQLERYYLTRWQNTHQDDDSHRNRVDILAWLLNITSVNVTDTM